MTTEKPSSFSLRDFLDKLLSGRSSILGYAILAILLLVVLPMTLSAFRLNLCGKYLCYAFCCIGLVLCWGHAGILSLGQGLFFGVGGYSMAMFLKLEASSMLSHDASWLKQVFLLAQLQ